MRVVAHNVSRNWGQELLNNQFRAGVRSHRRYFADCFASHFRFVVLKQLFDSRDNKLVNEGSVDYRR